MPDTSPRSQPPPQPASLRWAREFLPHYFTDAPADFHAELLADLEKPAHRLIARVAPRGHAKSTCASLAYPLWCACEHKRRNIVIITHESSLARQFLRDIRLELESNDQIIAAYGDLCAPDRDPEEPAPAKTAGKSPRTRPRTKKKPRTRWSQDMFTTATGVTLQAKSSGGSFRGARVGPQRPDLIICDDLEKDDRVASPDGRRKLEHWLRRVVMPALAPGGQLLVLGSLLHYDSLLANLRDPVRFPRWNYRVYRAMEAAPAADGQFYLQALWPARWPVEKLQEERERIGTTAFDQEYQANPIDDTLRVFRPEWLLPYDPATLDSRRELLVNLMAVDPATGKSAGDFFALWVGSVDLGTGIIYTRQLTLERINIVDQIKRIVAAFQRWRPVKVAIETNAYQVALKDSLDDLSRKHRLYMPVVSLHSSIRKEIRIEGTAAFYENGTFRLPPNLDPEAEAQFLHFPKGGCDDAPDVCAMGIELARNLRSATPIRPVRAGQRNPYARKGTW